MELGHFFQLNPVPVIALKGSYNLILVGLSYVIASLASFVALDITERIRTNEENIGPKIGWLILGAFAMGMGIWTMHFIGMLAFMLPMPMDYEPILTTLSMIIAVIASGFAFYLIKNEKVKPLTLAMGGVLLGLGICSMHYTGMAAMLHVHIRYIPSIFILSILIAIVASEAALWLMIRGSQTSRQYHTLLKLGSALIMGFAICGMHYTGMAAAVFTENESESSQMIKASALDPTTLSFYISTTTLAIMGIALTASRFWMNAFQMRNQKLIETEVSLEQKSLELQKLNQNLIDLAENAVEREDRIRAILAAAADGIIVTNEKGIVEISNRAAGGILGYSPDEMTDKSITNFIGTLDLKENRFRFVSFSCLIEKNDILIESAGLVKGGKIIPLELTISQSIIKGNIVYIVVFRDITDRKRSEQKLASLNYQLLSSARLAGMAEVATGVIHNVGNVLNSINVSTQLLLEREYGVKAAGLAEIARLLQAHKNELDVFMKTHPVGELLPQYLEEVTDYIKKESAFFRSELESLNAKLQHMKSIITMQQSLSGNSTISEKVQLNALLEDALLINFEKIEKYGITVERDFSELPIIETDRVKIMQALINLIKNAAEAVVESRKEEKRLTVRTSMLDPDYVKIEVIDNGIGIKAENIKKIFSYGFTTKKSGHGFGLHTSALSIQEMGGTLQAYSSGPDEGAAFIIILPRQMKNKEKPFSEEDISNE